MKSFRFLMSIVLLSLCTVAFAQSDAQKSFTQMKTLAGIWEGRVTVAEHPDMDNKQVRVTLRVTSMGNALMHEMSGAGRPDDPITMIYLDGDRLTLTHYCDAGNRPRMTGALAADGKTVQFNLLDVSGSTQYGHMHGSVFTLIDPDHHSEDWTFMEGDKPVHAHIELQRAK